MVVHVGIHILRNLKKAGFNGCNIALTYKKLHCNSSTFQGMFELLLYHTINNNYTWYNRPLVKRGITEFRHGIPDVHLTHKKNFTAVIIGYISIRCYDVW